MKLIVPSLVLPALVLATRLGAGEQDKPEVQTAAGWVKYDKNPVLGGKLGTCFDIAVLREGGK